MRQSPPPPERRHRDRYGRSGRRTVKKWWRSQPSKEHATLPKIRGHCLGIQLFRYAERTANTTFRDRRTDLPPLAHEPRHRTTRPSTTQVA
jgi:hypothetical protein